MARTPSATSLRSLAKITDNPYSRTLHILESSESFDLAVLRCLRPCANGTHRGMCDCMEAAALSGKCVLRHPFEGILSQLLLRAGTHAPNRSPTSDRIDAQAGDLMAQMRPVSTKGQTT